MNDAFESAEFLIRQTKADMERFKATFNAWISHGSYTGIIETDSKTGNKTHKLKFSNAVPEDLRGITNNALNNLRHCFDQANSVVYEIVNGTAAPDKFYFPFTNGPDDLDGRLRNAYFANFPTPALDAIKGIEPYPTSLNRSGGNDLFSTFCGAAGRNKHRTTANLNGSIPFFRTNGITGTKIIEIGMPPSWNVAKGEMILGITSHDGNLNYDFQIIPEITFGNAGKLTNAPVYGSCLAIADLAEKLINKFNASVLRGKESAGLSRLM